MVHNPTRLCNNQIREAVFGYRGVCVRLINIIIVICSTKPYIEQHQHQFVLANHFTDIDLKLCKYKRQIYFVITFNLIQNSIIFNSFVLIILQISTSNYKNIRDRYLLSKPLTRAFKDHVSLTLVYWHIKLGTLSNVIIEDENRLHKKQSLFFLYLVLLIFLSVYFLWLIYRSYLADIFCGLMCLFIYYNLNRIKNNRNRMFFSKYRNFLDNRQK